MEEGPKLVYRKTPIHINKGKVYGRQGKAPTGLISNIVDYVFSMTTLLQLGVYLIDKTLSLRSINQER